MNARSNTIEIKCRSNQAYEAVLALFHSILYHRAIGKISYKSNSCYSIGSLEHEEIVCDYLNFTYVQCKSKLLASSLNQAVKEFIDKLREDPLRTGIINMEFYTKRKSKGMLWAFIDQSLVWEIWSIKITCMEDHATTERIEDQLLDKLLTIVQIVNGERCNLPQMPDENNVDSVFDTSYKDVYPYLYRINHRTGSTTSSNLIQLKTEIGLKKFIKDAFAI